MPYWKASLFWLCLGSITLSVHGVESQDPDLKKGEGTRRFPDYTTEDELPRETLTVPGSSAGTFYEDHRFGDAFMGRWQPRYSSYGWDDYQNYRLNTTPYLRNYDSFGNFIADGYEIFQFQEYRTRAPLIGSEGNKGQFYQNWLHHLIVADDSYGSWSTRVIVGDFIHTTFTPLTLDMVNFNGIRFDAASVGNHELTLIVSRISDPLKQKLTGPGENFNVALGKRGDIENVNDGVYMMGGHWESGVGDNLVFGASYVNLHRFDSQRGFRTNTRKGLAPPNSVPNQIIVRFEDDSPEDGIGGAAVFDLVATVTMGPAFDDPDAGETRVTLAPQPPELSPGAVVRGRHLEASGVFRTDGIDRPVYIDYTFDLEAAGLNNTEVVGVEFSALVANDYKISLAQNHTQRTGPRSTVRRETDFQTIRRAENNIVDMSNKQFTRFDYGLSTGVEVFGVNGRLLVPGLEMHGELAKSANHFQYPSALGKRSDFDDVAGYLTVDKEWSHWSFGAELFSIGAKYTSYNPHPSDPRNPVPTGEVFYFNPEQEAGRERLRQDFYADAQPGGSAINPFYTFVDDNDNMLYDERADNWVRLKGGGTPKEGSIFPYFDLDQDGHQDTNRNRNEFADWDEPFLMYFSDPQEFHFGDDYNNNFITDAWEDDSLPNYPYYKDEQGLHLLTALEPLNGLKLSVGRYDVDQIAAGGHNDVVYGKVNLDRHSVSRWRVRWDHESKSVKDDISNPYFRFLLQEGIEVELDRRNVNVGALSGSRYTQTFFSDELEARDSFINRGLFRAEYQPRERWNIEGRLRYELNHQNARRFASGNEQLEDDIDFYGAILRTDYSYRWGSLDLSPRFKAMYRLWERSSEGGPFLESLQVLPILRADYHFGSGSQLRLGVQGLPLLADRRKDFANAANDADLRSWTFMWFNETEYEGYRLGLELGILREEVDFDNPDRPDTRFTRFFVRMLSGSPTLVR